MKYSYKGDISYDEFSWTYKEGNRKMNLCHTCKRSNMMMHDAKLCCDCWWRIMREIEK